MLIRVCFSLVLFVAIPVWAQLEATPFEMNTTSSDQTQMLTPPPVSGEAYPTTVGSQTRSNYLAAGVIVNVAYVDNVVINVGATPVRDGIYSILPTISLNQTTQRRSLTLSYSPGFTLYQNTSSLNAANQTAGVDFQCRLTQHINFGLNEIFQKSSNVFNQINPFSGGTVSGSTQSTAVDVIAPYANRLSNTTNAVVSYQFSRNGMVGAGGTLSENSYPNSSEASSFYNSNSRGGSVFYSQRLSSKQYLGVIYQYFNSQANPVDAQANTSNMQTEVHTHTFSAFYTIYLNPTLSLSFSGGPQYFEATQSFSSQVGSWTPSFTASMGWQRSHTNFVASYSRTVTGSGGLLGAFNSNTTNGSARWLLARTLSVALSGGYSITKNAAPALSTSSEGGHSVSATALVQHSILEHLQAEIGYVRLHQSYNGIPILSESPDSNREYISVSYQFTRPLGR